MEVIYLLHVSVGCRQFSVSLAGWKAQFSVPASPYLTLVMTSNSLITVYKFCYNEYLYFRSHRCIKSLYILLCNARLQVLFVRKDSLLE